MPSFSLKKITILSLKEVKDITPTISVFSQPSQILHKYKSYRPKLFPIEPEYQHMKNARELVTKISYLDGILCQKVKIKIKIFMNLFLSTMD